MEPAGGHSHLSVEFYSSGLTLFSVILEAGAAVAGQ